MTGWPQAEAERLEDEAEAQEAFEAEEARFRPDRVSLAGRVRYMARAEGFVMARRPDFPPFVETESAWLARPLWSDMRADK